MSEETIGLMSKIADYLGVDPCLLLILLVILAFLVYCYLKGKEHTKAKELNNKQLAIVLGANKKKKE